LDDSDVVEFGCLLRILERAQIYFFRVYHQQDLPVDTVRRYSSIVGTSETLVEVSMIDLRDRTQDNILECEDGCRIGKMGEQLSPLDLLNIFEGCLDQLVKLMRNEIRILFVELPSLLDPEQDLN
jgi:hypothetical protein